jgi:hypothetical protein
VRNSRRSLSPLKESNGATLLATQETIMAGDIAVAAVAAFSVGVMSGMMVTIVVALRQDRGRTTLAGQSLQTLERHVRRALGVGGRGSAVRSDRF